MLANDRYSRQTLLNNIGNNGQKKLAKSRVVIIGCGALGTTIANNLARSGIGYLRIVDRDLVDLSNLQLQNLFEESDVGLPKASVVAEKLRAINSEITVEALADDVTYENIEGVIETMDVVLDGTDNMLIRFLINDACINHKIPWIYGSAIETYGMTMNILPNHTPCFRCIIPDLPGAGILETCDTVGVLNSIPMIIASIETTEALKILLNKNINRDLLIYDVWNHNFQKIKVERNSECECCEKHNFEFLNAEKKEMILSLCGRGAIQITPAKNMEISFQELGAKLQKLGEIELREIILRFKISGYELNIFRNGRTIVIGTNDVKTAKSLYTKYVGI